VIVVVILLGLGWYGLRRLGLGTGVARFPMPLIAVDTAVLTTISIEKEDEQLTFRREDAGWIVSNGRLHLRALADPMHRLLEVFSLIQTHGLFDKEAVADGRHGTDPPEGLRVRLYAGEQALESFTLGRFHFDPQQRRYTSYLRLAGQQEIHIVDGERTLPLRTRFEAYRHRELLRLPHAARITRLEYHRSDTTFRFERLPTGWRMNGAIPIDSSEAETFLRRLRQVKGGVFADDFDELMAQSRLLYTLSIHGEDLPAPIELHCYSDSSRQPPFVLRSSMHPEVFFASDSSGLYHELFSLPEKWRALAAPPTQ